MQNPVSGPGNGTPLMNWSRLEEIRGYDSKGVLVRKVVRSFVHEGESRIAAIVRAAGDRDAAALAAAAHALKGAALNIGAAALAELCATLEAWGKEGLTDGAAATAALVGQRFRETAQALEKDFPAQAGRRNRTLTTKSRKHEDKAGRKPHHEDTKTRRR